jgi:hypothetical protein
MLDSFATQIHSDEASWKYEQELECYEELERESRSQNIQEDSRTA